MAKTSATHPCRSLSSDNGPWSRLRRIWDPQTGHQLTILEGHEDEVHGVCSVVAADRHLLVSASDDRTVRIWDPRTGTCSLTVPTYHPALALARVSQSLAIGLTAGILVIKANPVM